MVRGGPANRTVRKAKIFALTKGFRGRRKNCYSLAVRAAHKALQYAYIGRRLKKRDMRKLWIQRINFASQSHSISYARLMSSMVKCNIQVNRKVLSELAIHEPRTFAALAGVAKQRWQNGTICSLEGSPLAAPPQGYRGRGKVPNTAPLFKGRAPDKGKPNRRPINDLLYNTTRVVDERSGRVVMETAV